MASALIRIASPGVVLLAYVWTVAGGLPVTEGAPDSGPGGLSLAESRRLAAEADALIEEDRGGEAVDKLTALLEVYPNNHIYMWSLAEAHLANGNHAAAASMMELYMDRAPVGSGACPTIGDTYVAAGEPRKALDSYRRCMEVEPSNPDHVLAAGLMLERIGDLAARG